MRRFYSYNNTGWGIMFVFLLSLGDLVYAFRPDKEPVKEYSILFIGNSLTYTNDLPRLVEKAAKTQGFRVEADMLTQADYALEDHWSSGKLPGAIAAKKYDFVIIQQGPSSQADGRASLLLYGEKINALCDSNGSRLAIFMVWPALYNYKMFDGVIQNYSGVAATLGALLCPVGEVWKEHIDRENDFSYYGGDLFHPSPKGSEVAAEVIVQSLFPK